MPEAATELPMLEIGRDILQPEFNCEDDKSSVALATTANGEQCLVKTFKTASRRRWHEVMSIRKVDGCGYGQNPKILGIIGDGPESPVSIVMEFMGDVSSESSVLVHSMIVLLNPLNPYM